MTERHNRISQQNLADAIASAAEIEEQRIEQIGDDVVEQVGGGDPRIGTTMGYFPVDRLELE